MSDFINSLWPRSLFTWLGSILAAMSVVKLMQFGFQFGFGPTFTLALNYYERLIHAVFGWWAEPIVRAWVADLATYFNWDLHLYPHWKHVFVLMGIYFSRLSAGYFRVGLLADAILFFVWGIVTALAASVAAGIVPLVQGDMWTNFAIAVIPVVGFTLYELGWAVGGGKFFRPGLFLLFIRPLVGVVLILAGLQISIVQRLASPGLVMLCVLIVILALHFLWIGRHDIHFFFERIEPGSKAYWRIGAAAFGVELLAVFFWVSLFIAANAGLRFYGL